MRPVEHLSGLRYSTLLMIWIFMVFVFGFVYFSLSAHYPTHGVSPFDGATSLEHLYNTFYFSLVTATTVGYGDIHPLGLSRLLAGTESVLAFFIFAVFVSKLITHRQEIALHQIHKLTFEGVFANTREGFFIIRKDFDRILAEVQEQKKLSEHSWENLTTAYQEGQSLLEQIPDFYDHEHDLYTIDARREQLLKEAVHRTLQRMNQLLDVLSTHHIDWKAHEQSLKELQELVRIVEHILPLWRERSPSQEAKPFEDILALNREIQERLRRSMDN